MDTEDKDLEMVDAGSIAANDDVEHHSHESSTPEPDRASSSSKTNPSASTAVPTTMSNTIGSLGVTDPEDTFFVHSNNSPTFKYKYPQAAPTPDGEDDKLWNKIYTAADSRMYNKHHKSANESRKYRESGETRTLALRMLIENKEKHARAISTGGSLFAVPKMAPKPKPPVKSETFGIKRESSFDLQELLPGAMPMSISEKIKSDGRKRKALSDTPSSQQGTPAPSTQKLSSPVPKAGSPAPSKMDKPPLKKKGTAAPVKKAAPKKPRTEAEKSSTTTNPLRPPPGQSPGSSNDGGEYCICRGPDDHRMMVFCEGGCEDWYHCSCVGIDEDDAKELLDRFICPNCADEARRTSWKRLCRLNNCNEACRKAARVNDNSKYCSDEHKEAFWEFVYNRLRSDDAPSMGGALSRQEAADVLNSIETVEDLHALGQKPKLPIPASIDPGHPVGLDYITADERATIDDIQRKKAIIEAQIQGYKNQQQLLTFVSNRLKTANKHPSLDVKDICGYDSRLAMNEAEFKDWFESQEGKDAFAANAIGPRLEETKAIGAHIPYPGQVTADAPEVPEELGNICLKPRKKCKHGGWLLLHNQDFGIMQLNLKEQLKRLTESEEEIVDDAETREATKSYYADNVTVQLF